MKSVSIRNIGKDFLSLRRGKVTALRQIDLEIEAGSFFVILGPSGCGKSTLLNIIAGIEKPSAGEIFIGEKKAVSVNEKIFLSPKERDVAMVFQSYALYPHMTVFENIAFPLRIAKVKKDEIKNSVEQVSEMLQISHLLDAKPGELSGGQRQRVALGRAVVRKPNVLLLDEPLSNLDALLRISMRGQLKHLQRQLNVTTIYVTHDQTEAISLGDRIAILNDGEVMQIGTPEDIYNEPENLFVAKFIGSPPMNIVDGNSVSNTKLISFLPNGYNINNVMFGIRPENLTLCSREDGILQGKVDLISNIGSENIIYVSIANLEVLVKAEKNPGLSEEKTIGVKFKDKDLFLFDKKSGKRIKLR